MLVSGEAPVPPRVAGNEDVVGKALGHAGGDRADAHFATPASRSRGPTGLLFFRSWMSCLRSSIE